MMTAKLAAPTDCCRETEKSQFKMNAAPLKIKSGTGSPIRALALVPKG